VTKEGRHERLQRADAFSTATEGGPHPRADMKGFSLHVARIEAMRDSCAAMVSRGGEICQTGFHLYIWLPRF